MTTATLNQDNALQYIAPFTESLTREHFCLITGEWVQVPAGATIHDQIEHRFEYWSNNGDRCTETLKFSRALTAQEIEDQWVYLAMECDIDEVLGTSIIYPHCELG